MACEVPVISSNTGGIPEVNEHGVTGFLADVGDVESMANYALDLLMNEDKLNMFKANALAQAKTFSLDKVLDKYVSVYNRHLK